MDQEFKDFLILVVLFFVLSGIGWGVIFPSAFFLVIGIHFVVASAIVLLVIIGFISQGGF